MVIGRLRGRGGHGADLAGGPEPRGRTTSVRQNGQPYEIRARFSYGVPCRCVGGWCGEGGEGGCGGDEDVEGGIGEGGGGGWGA